MSRKHPVDPYTASVIDALGGTSVVARICELDPSTVSEWKRESKGFPKSWGKYLRRLNPAAFRANEHLRKSPH